MVGMSSRTLMAAAALLLTAATTTPSFDELRDRINAAYTTGDIAALLELLPQAATMRPGNQTILYLLAYAHAANDEPEQALAVMNRVVDLQIVPTMFRDHQETFAATRALPGYAALAARVGALAEPVGDVALTLCAGPGDTIPEGVAVAPDGTLFLTSVRHGGLYRIDNEDAVTHIDTPGGSTMGLHFDTSGLLWVATSALPQYSGDDAATGVFAFNPQTDTVVGMYPFEAEGSHAFGDFVLLPDGGLVATDSLGRGAYRLDRVSGSWTLLAGTDALRSPQGIVVNGAGLVIADYGTGLYHYDLATDELTRIGDGPGVPYGIDGLYAVDGHLVAIQNGITPNRVVRYTLTADGTSVQSSEILAMNHPLFDEPTLGVVVGDRFLFIANSHWNKFDAENGLPDGLAPPCILEVSLGRR